MRYGLNNEFAGFVPSLGEARKFNILCVTFRQSEGDRSAFHLATPSDTAEVKTVTYTSLLSSMDKTMVLFDGGVHELLSMRSGLNGCCLVLRIKLGKPGGIYDIWDLYTDTPNPKADRPEEVTSESLREHADRCVNPFKHL